MFASPRHCVFTSCRCILFFGWEAPLPEIKFDHVGTEEIIYMCGLTVQDVLFIHFIGNSLLPINRAFPFSQRVQV